MSLATYSDLQTSIANWLDRSDLTSVIPDFIAIAESTFNTEGAIRTQFNRTSTSVTLTASQNYITLPTDFLAPDALIITASNTKQVIGPYGSAAALYTQYAQTTTGIPKGMIPLASKLELAPTPDSAYTGTLYYYQKIPALASNSTNWLLTNYPNIYLFGSLVASEAFLGNDPAISKWGNLYDNAIQKLQGANDRNKYGSSLSVKTDVVV